MASTTVDSTSDSPIQPESIPTVDIRLISQPELNALSLCSDGELNTRRCDDVVTPKIDRSVFNESAGSRKQTYSRLRLAPAGSTTATRSRAPHLRSPMAPPNNSIDKDPERVENPQIVDLFKELFASETNGNDLVPIRVEPSDSAPELSNLVSSVGKRKRGRPRKDEKAAVPVVAVTEVGGDDVLKDIIVYESVEGRDREIVNQNCAGVVDMGSNARKGERGRPDKDENVAVPVDVKAVGGDDMAKYIVVYENVDDRDRDREIVNKNGAEVVDIAVSVKAMDGDATTDNVVSESVENRDREIVNKNGGLVVDMVSNSTKRKRGRPRKNEIQVVQVAVKAVGGDDVTNDIVEDRGKEIVNKNGAAIMEMVRPRKDENPVLLVAVKAIEGDDVTKDNVVSANVEDRDREIVNKNGTSVVDMVSNSSKRKRGRPRKKEIQVAQVAVKAVGGDDVTNDIVEDRGKEIVNKNGAAVMDMVRPWKDENPVLPVAVKAVEGDAVAKDNVVSENVEDRDREIVNKNGTSVVDMVSNSSKRKRGRPRKNEIRVVQVAVKAVGGDDVTNDIVEDRNKEIVNNNAMAAVVDMVSNVNKRKRGRPRKDEPRVVPVAVKTVGADDVTRVVPVAVKTVGADDVTNDIIVFQNIEDRDRAIVNKNAATVVDMVNNVRKRKRGRPRKDENTVVPVAANVVSENVEDRDREIVNKNGVVVDMVALACLEDPYGLELRRRTEGLVTKEELLGFLVGLNGQWGSTRKKRKIVDASDFGDALPKGWKLLLSLKKKRGSVWLFCRRYISPNGRQFMSCKEVSSYVLSVSGLQDSNQRNCAHSNEGIQPAYKMASGNGARLAATEDHEKENLVCDPSSAITSISRNHEKQINLNLKIKDPVVGDLKCCECTVNFDGKEDLLHHLLFSHGRKISEIDPSITDRVITQSGQYECQFCHKTFNESNHYDSHIRAHVKNDVKCTETSLLENVAKSVDPVLLGGVPYMESLKQASTGVNSNVVAEICDANANDGLNSDSSHGKFKARSSIETYPDRFDHDLNFLPHDKQDMPANRDCETSGEANVIQCVANRINKCFDGPESSERCSTSPFPNEQACGVDNNVSRVSARVEEQNQVAVFESGLLAPNGDDRCFTSIMDEFKLDREKFAKDESISGFCISHAGVDEDNVTGVEQHTSSEGRSLVPSGMEQFDNMKRVTTATSRIGSESRIPTSFADEETCGVEDNLNKVSTSSVVPKRDGMYNFGVNGRGSYAGSDATAVTSLEEEKHFESCSVVSSWNEQTPVMENYGNEVSTCVVEELRHQKYSESSLNFLSAYEQNYGAGNYVDKLSTRKMEPPKLNEVPNWRNSEQLSFPFGSRHSGLNADGASLVTSTKERTIEFCSLVPSGNEQTFPVQSNVIEAEQTFGVQTNLCGVNNSMVVDPKKGRGSVSDLFSLSFNGETCGFNNSVYTDRDWEGPKVGEVGNSENNKFMIGFGSGHIQPDEDVLGGIWRTGEENALHRGLADTPNPLVQSSSSFCTFDMSDKAEDGLFRLGEKYGSEPAFEGLRLGRSEPVEFSFLTTQDSSSSRQGDTKGFSYESEMEQEFDPSFWLGRDALMPNVVGRDQVTTTTTVCVWCRTEFRQEQPVHSVTHAAIGFMCPTCRARISDTR